MSISIAPANQLHWIEGESVNVPAPVVRETGLLREALRLLGRHKLLLVAVFLAVAAAGAAIGYALPPVYKASSTVLIGMSRKEAVTSREVLSDIPMDSEAIASELELLDSRELLERVCDRLKLVQDPEFNPALRTSQIPAALAPVAALLTKWREEILPPGPATASRPMNDVVDAFRRHLVVTPVGRSRAIRITFSSRNPQTAAAVVNTLAEVYTDEHLRLRDEATREANDWIGERIVQLRTRADEAARVVDQYQAEHGLVRGRDSLLIQQELTELSTQLTTARARRMEADATLADVQQAITSGRPERVATVLNSPLIQRLREQESQLAARRADIESRAGAAYPSALAVGAELRDVQGRISAEVGRIVQSVRDQQKIAQTNEAALTARMAQVRLQVDQANTKNVGLQERQREADADNALYQTFLTRSKETEPQFNFPTVNVRVLSRAVPPEHPASPNRLLIALSSLVVGLIAGCAVIFAKETLAGGVRTRGDVERLIGAAPLGTIPFLRRPGRPQEQARLDEAVSSLWARLMASPASPRPRSLVITSALLQEGKTTLARLLGLAAADRGQRVLLVDADLRCSSLTANMMGRNPRPGLAEIIRGEADVTAVTVRYGSNLDIVPAGECRGSPVRLLTSAAFTAFLRRAEADYDLVIIDAPPVLIGADSWLLACNAQATVMLARWGHTPPSAIAAALKQLSDVRVKCLGVVMSLVDTSKHAHYDEAASLARSRQARRYYAKLVAPQ